MDIEALLKKEWLELADYPENAVSISTTAKHAEPFKVLPRREANGVVLGCFLINDEALLQETIAFFDGKVTRFYVDIEAKQDIDLFRITKANAVHTRVTAWKPNDMTMEACDLLLRNHFRDDLSEKNVLIIGTGNLAGKLALRIAERRANVVMDGRSSEKTAQLISTFNQLTPRFNPELITFNDWQRDNSRFDAVISFLSGPYWQEEALRPYLDKETVVIDGGINNFSRNMIHYFLDNSIAATRLDVRLGLDYQFLYDMKTTNDFFCNVYGQKSIGDTTVVAGGWMGEEGTIIVDRIEAPSQVIGVADGRGGLKETAMLSLQEKQDLETIQSYVQKPNDLSDGDG